MTDGGRCRCSPVVADPRSRAWNQNERGLPPVSHGRANDAVCSRNAKGRIGQLPAGCRRGGVACVVEPEHAARTHRGPQPIGGFTLFDRTISLAFAGAAGLWIVGFGLILANVFGQSDHLGHLGIGLCCGGAVLMIRSMMCQALQHLERDVFELGRDAGRAETPGVPLQRVF